MSDTRFVGFTNDERAVLLEEGGRTFAMDETNLVLRIANLKQLAPYYDASTEEAALVELQRRALTRDTTP